MKRISEVVALPVKSCKDVNGHKFPRGKDASPRSEIVSTENVGFMTPPLHEGTESSEKRGVILER